MTVGTILALVILVSFLVTLLLAIGSYVAYKLREARRPRPLFHVDTEFQFFERYIHTEAAQVARVKRAAEKEDDESYATSTWATDPGRSNPGATNPGGPAGDRTDPGTTDPNTTDPNRTDPDRTDPWRPFGKR